MRVPFTSLIAAGALTALTACGGGLKGAVNNAVCNIVPLPASSIPQMIYPMPGYAQTPANAPAMVVGYTGSPALAQTITLQPTGGSEIGLGPFGAAPKVMPTPAAKALPGRVEYGVTLPALAKNTSYDVSYKYVSSLSLCGTSTTSTVKMGSFSTAK